MVPFYIVITYWHLTYWSFERWSQSRTDPLHISDDGVGTIGSPQAPHLMPTNAPYIHYWGPQWTNDSVNVDVKSYTTSTSQRGGTFLGLDRSYWRIHSAIYKTGCRNLRIIRSASTNQEIASICMLRLIMGTNRAGRRSATQQSWCASVNDRERNDDHVIHEFDHVRFIVYVADLVNCVVNRLTARQIYNSDASHSARYDWRTFDYV
jgi:hypothetical protein